MAIRSAVEKLTPDLAERMLDAVKDDKHAQNRHVKDSHVDWLASQMKAGKWHLNGEPIILDDQDLLLDGQHRLYAILSSGVTIESVVTRGVPRESFCTIDTGAGRTTGDTLGIKGEANCTTLAATLGWLYRWEQGKMLSGVKACGFSHELALTMLRKHAGIRDIVTWSNGQRLHPILSRVPASALALLKYVFALHKPNKAEEFFAAVSDPRLDRAGEPTETLRNWLLKKEQSRARSRMMAGTLATMAVFVKAWEAFLSGVRPKAYVWYRTGANPESFPVFPGEKETRGKAIRGTVNKEEVKKRRVLAAR